MTTAGKLRGTVTRASSQSSPVEHTAGSKDWPTSLSYAGRCS